MIMASTRRDFLAGASAASLVLASGGARAAEGKPLGVAVCGLGSLSTEQIAPALQKTRLCRLAGIVTGSPEKARRWQAQYHLPARSIYDYESMARMADDPDIDIVYVVTPNAL